MLGRRQKQIPGRKPSQARGSSTPVFSYYASRSDNSVTTGRHKPKHNFQLKLIPTYVALITIFFSIIYVATLSTDPRIVPHGHDDSVVLQSTEIYRYAAQELLGGSVFNYSKLLINTREIERKIQDQFPELVGVSITVPLISRRPIVAIEPATPALVLATKNGNYVIDQQGVAILKPSNLDAFVSLELPRISDESDLDPETGKQSLPSDDVRFITEIARQLMAKNLELESMTLPAIANELHVKIKGEGYVVKFNLQGDPRLQAGTYLAVKERLARDGVKPSEYVDVRVEEKAFYR